MEQKLLNYLLTSKLKTIKLDELEKLATGITDYAQFAQDILNLEQGGILKRIKSHGENYKSPSLAFTYRINHNQMKQELQLAIKVAKLSFHPDMYLESYFRLPISQWIEDYPMLEKINLYLQHIGCITEYAPAPERSFEIVGDEKWITEGQGKELLERIQLWDKLLIIPVADPLMFAVNPKMFQEPHHHHLIVENKTTYQGLLPALEESNFTSLIYGSGKKIIKSIENFDYQLPLPQATHTFFYFGDVDLEGTLIWYLLSKKKAVKPALPFYEQCFQNNYAIGKQNHIQNTEAVANFIAHFQPSQQHHMLEMFQNGGYYPQEILKGRELQQIWRDSIWT
ncbi:Wadjet anti-phage system protein JetD domain-containing protein [Psychrobacillus sp. L4]|uniref:Wadjet anti-phage system protein JetD domain-containing protein n=1 Tax=Psychrobacillus sp. L4 TaxID=3236892 RepID=UPI0036F32421